jgi:Zn-dependent protease
MVTRIALQIVLGILAWLSFWWMFSGAAATLIIYAISIHELGHIWAARALGYKTNGWFLIPFLGGVALHEKCEGRDHALIALAGPIVGLLSAGVPYAYWITTGDRIGAVCTTMVFGMNMFNLIPLPPLDGFHVARHYGPSSGFMAMSLWMGVPTLYPQWIRDIGKPMFTPAGDVQWTVFKGVLWFTFGALAISSAVAFGKWVASFRWSPDVAPTQACDYSHIPESQRPATQAEC